MAKNLDLQEQEQIDQIKHLWKQYGTAVVWFLVVVLACFAGWNGYRYWQQKQGTQASALFDEVDRAAQTGDLAKLEQSFNDIRSRYGGSIPAQQAGLLAGKVFHDKGKPVLAKDALTWTADKAGDDGLRALAKLRLASVLVEEKAYDEALKQIASNIPEAFAALASDRRGDIYTLQGKPAEAIAQYASAYKAMDPKLQYRRMVGIKLNALGVDPEATTAPTATTASTP